MTFYRDIAQRVKSHRPSAMIVPLFPIDHWKGVDESPMVAIDEGSTPGVHPSTVTIDGGKVMIAGASHGPWVDLNLWLFNYAASVAHGRPVTLAYQPEMSVRDGRMSLLPEGSRALAIAEAAMLGGSWVLGLDDELRLGLYQQDPKALRDWGTITAYQTFFAQHFRELQLSPLTNVAVIVDSLGETSEVMNLIGPERYPISCPFR